MRPWWIHSISSINNHGDYIYSECTISNPPPMIIDRSDGLDEFERYVESGDWIQLKGAIEMETIFMPNVLCPFGCTEYCFDAGTVDIDVIIQRHLLRINLQLYSTSKYENFFSMTETFFRDADDYDGILLGDDDGWIIRPTMIFTDDGPKILTCNRHGDGDKYLRLYPPRPPRHNLSARQADQLSHAISTPRIIQSTSRSKNNTSHSMGRLYGGFAGIDSGNISTHSSWKTSSYLMAEHECNMLSGRHDLVHLLAQKVEAKQVTPELASNLIGLSKQRVPDGSLDKYRQGATYVPIGDVIILHLAQSHDDGNCGLISAIKQNGTEVSCRRSWSRTINIVQMEDSKQYGFQFRPIPPFGASIQSEASMITWTMCSILSSVKELWQAIDSKTTPFMYTGWEGWLLTYLQSKCFSFDSIRLDPRSPFKRITSATAIIAQINSHAPVIANIDVDQYDPTQLYQCSGEFMQNLFSPHEYPTILMSDSILDVIMMDEVEFVDKNIIIISGLGMPEAFGSNNTDHRDNIVLDDGTTYELRSVVLTRVQGKDYSSKPGKYEAIRYMRHGGHYKKWWKQERNDKISTQCVDDPISHLSSMYDESDDLPHFLYHTMVYVIQKPIEVDQYRLKILQTMGGKIHVRCCCNDFPLIPTNAKKGFKKKCFKCNRDETYMCTNIQCPLRVCSGCYKTYPLNSVTTLDPAIDRNSNNSLVEDDNEENDDDDDDSSQEEDDDIEEVYDDDDDDIFEAYFREGEHSNGNDENNNSSENNNESDDTAEEMLAAEECVDQFLDEGEIQNLDDFVTYADIDVSQEQTEDNAFMDNQFLTTQFGDTPVEIEHDTRMDRVSGCVMYNQAAVCTTRGEKRITTSNFNKNFVQKFCATTPGQICPLLTLESCLSFGRIFYSNATDDKYAVLGALPTWVYGPKRHTNGFTSVLDTTRSRITASGSITSTDPHYQRFGFDIMGNIMLSKGDSRQIMQRGFSIEDSDIGLCARGGSDPSGGLTEMVDSQKMVRGLAASQKFIKYELFITVTPNQRKTPGLSHITAHKRSLKWTKHFPDFHRLPLHEQNELIWAMEEASGLVILRQWLECRRFFLKYMMEKVSFLGCKGKALFHRDEYQTNKGNPPHGHLTMALDTSNISGDAARHFEDMIRTSVFDIIHPEQGLELMEKGFLKDLKDMQDYIDTGDEVLAHRVCNPRCFKLRKKGESTVLECRKRHSVFGSPDSTSHQYIPMKVNLSPKCIEILHEIGLCHTDENGQVMYDHQYFRPTTHMAPCTKNATCNMSPIISEIFLFFCSMCNVQSVGHANGIIKYILKYVGKFDLANRAIASTDSKTGNTKVGTEFVHNTKISSSKHLEEKSFNKRRESSHPCCRDMPMLELLQLLLGIPEVITNLKFVEISTLPFEVRSRSKVNLDSSGNVERPNESGGRGGQSSNTTGNTYHATAQNPATNGRRSDFFNRTDADAHISGIPAKRVRERSDLHIRQRMTPSQVETARDHQKSSRVYDQISIHSLRPPELLKVIQNPGEYFRFMHIEPEIIKEDEMKKGLNKDLRVCKWFDCIGRHVKMRRNALDEVKELVERQLADPSFDQLTDEFPICETILEIIRVYTTDDDALSTEDLEWKETLGIFIYDDGDDLLPIPVFTPINPANTHEFFVHGVLSMGYYDTEIDVLRNPSPRECLRKAGLIGDATDEDSLRTYVNELTLRYILEQVVYFANSMRKTDDFIILAYRVFEEIIMHDSFVANEIPFTVTELFNKAEDEQLKWWNNIRSTQLTAIYRTLDGIPNLPPREDIENATRYNPLEWDTVGTMIQSTETGQSVESFEEQKLAVKTIAHSIDKYCGITHGNASFNYTKNCVAHGAPGTGKSFVGERSALYALSKGLRLISTCLMGSRANAIGGIHLHPLICIAIQGKNTKIYPYRVAELAMQKITRKKIKHHAILTVDVLFIDEVGQLSAELVAVLDIIFRKTRKSKLPFGGVLVIGTMDHTQLQPINALPFLMSTLVLTSFTMVKLDHSVRAASDPKFCRFQQLTRMNPLRLESDPDLKDEYDVLWNELFSRNCVPSFDHEKITRQTTRMYSEKEKVKNATRMYTEDLIRMLENDEDAEFRIRRSIDTHARGAGISEYTPASPSTIKSLNSNLREPETLVFFPWCIYECTTNHPNGHYNQSTLALLVDLPSQEVLDRWGTFEIFIAPPGTHHVDFLYDDVEKPTKAQLRQMGWTPVRIGVAPERNIRAKNGYHALRKQYSLKHVGATTINKSQGDTIPLGLALEISRENSCPWEKEQVVVAFSRTKSADKMIIVGDSEWARKKSGI